MTDSASDDDLELPAGWTVWSRSDDGRLVLSYRPDVFDAETFPAPCLPTLYLTHGRRTRRPKVNPTNRDDDDDWYVTLYLEPEVSVATERFSTRPDALERALALAREFDAGEIDYRGQYQVPRERYCDRLDELTGRGVAGRES